MVRNIAIKDSLYAKLSEMKGKGSFSNAIESLIEKCEIAAVQVGKREQLQASKPNTEVPACQ